MTPAAARRRDARTVREDSASGPERHPAQRSANRLNRYVARFPQRRGKQEPETSRRQQPAGQQCRTIQWSAARRGGLQKSPARR